MGWQLSSEVLAQDYKRARILALVVFLIQIPLLGLDLWRLSTGMLVDHIGYRYLMYLHIFLQLLLGVLLLLLSRPSSSGDGRSARAGPLLIGAAMVLMTAAAISIVDQLIHGEVTVYVLGAAGVAISVYLPLGPSILLFGLVHLLFVLALPAVQPNPDILTGHMINLTLLTAIAITANVTLYRQAVHNVERANLIDEQRDELRRLAWEDELTGLANRRYGDMRIREEMIRYLRYQRPFSLCMGDVDHFKQVNDSHSHSVGDKVLQRLADLMRRHLREVDLVVRYGGEEFVMVLPETSAPKATEVCEKLRAGIEAYDWESLSPGLEVTMSFGVADSASVRTEEEILEVADRRLYRAKAAGRNKVRGATSL